MDGSEEAYRALELATKIAERFGLEITLLTVIERISPTASPESRSPISSLVVPLVLGAFEEELASEGQRILDGGVKKVEEKSPVLKA